MPILPAGRLHADLKGSSAPDYDTIMGRPHIPAIAKAVVGAAASVRGLVEAPLSPLRRRDELLASWDRGIDVNLAGGAKLSAFDAASGHFVIHLRPKSLDDGYSLHVSLAPQGDEKNAVVQTHPHAPNAPVGFYNRAEAKGALEQVRSVLVAALADEDAARVNKLRAQTILDRLERTSAYLDALGASEAKQPVLAKLPEAWDAVHDSKKPGDALDQKYQAIAKEIGAMLAGDHGLPAEAVAQVKEDLETLAADRKKWHTWRASTGLFTLWVRD